MQHRLDSPYSLFAKHYPKTPRKHSVSDTILTLDTIRYRNLF